jgi:hypothetical protein
MSGLIKQLSSRRLSRKGELETVKAERDALKEENARLKAELLELSEEQQKVRAFLRSERSKIAEEYKRLDGEQESLKQEREQLAAQRERLAEAAEGWGVVNDGRDLVKSLQPRPKLTNAQLAPSDQQQQRFGRRVFSPAESSEALSAPPSPRSGRESPAGGESSAGSPEPVRPQVDQIVMPPPALARKGSSKSRRRGSLFDMFGKSKSSSSLNLNPTPSPRLLRRRGSALDRAGALIGVASAKSSPSVYGSSTPGWGDSGRVSESDPNYDRT